MSERAPEKSVQVVVHPLPGWIDARRLLGEHDWQFTALAAGKRRAQAQLSASDAAALAARLRGLGLDGAPLTVVIAPPLSRGLVRAARLADARARRDTTPGFSQPGARARGAGRFSLTPEPLALALAAAAPAARVVDACCGSGGNAIGFARAGCTVTAVDIDPERLAEAEHNARLYGVERRIQFVLGDALVQVPQLSGDVLFVDPPWGDANGYYDKLRSTRASFPLLDRLLQLRLDNYAQLWLKLPSSFATQSVAAAVPRAWFGEAAGDRQRIKFVQLVVSPAAAAGNVDHAARDS